jgi:hypothetical protein
MARWWRRKQPWHPARRCPWCGWYPPDASGLVRGRHDPNFTGHAWACPSSLYKGITTAEGIRDQQTAIWAWAGMAAD